MQSIDPDSQGPTTLNGTSDVEILTAPASGKRRQAIGCSVTNLDTSLVTVILQRNVSGTRTEIDRVSIPAGATDTSLITRDRPRHLAATTHSLDMKLSAVPAANQPKVEVAFLQSTD